MEKFYNMGHWAGSCGDHCPRPTSSQLPEGITLEMAREECRRGFDNAWVGK